jgi:hypothetical protein
MSQADNETNCDDFASMPHEVYQDAVNEIARVHNLSDSDKYDIECSAGSSKGDNYLGSVYRVTIKCKRDKSIKLSIIAKLPPQNEARREMSTTKIAFQREILFYEEIYPMFKQFQQEKNIDVDSAGFHEVPACHRTCARPYEGIFFEDLRVERFEMFDRFKDVTKDHVVLVMRTLAKMHAVFFAINDQYPVLTDSYRDMDDFMVAISEGGDSLLTIWFEGQKKLALETLKKCKNVENKRKIEKFLSTDLNELLQSMLGNKIAEPFSTICHGDVSGLL